MDRTFISLYDDHGDKYIVNVDRVSVIDVAAGKVWMADKATLSVCAKSMDLLIQCIIDRLGAFIDTERPRDLEGLCQSK